MGSHPPIGRAVVRGQRLRTRKHALDHLERHPLDPEGREPDLEGVAAARADPPDLVLIDLHLPDGSGLDVVAALRADARTAALPMVVVTADATARAAAEVAGAGAGLLTKPFALVDLLALVDDPRSGTAA